jgi:hypothetical protein
VRGARSRCQKVILRAVQDQIANPEHIAYILQQVEHEIAKLRSDLPDMLKLKEAEPTAEQRRSLTSSTSSARAVAAMRSGRP